MYDFRVIPRPTADPVDDPMFRMWLSAVARGFHQPRLHENKIAAEARLCLAEGWSLRGVYTTGNPAPAISDDEPVATFAEWRGELSLGDGRTVPLHQISDVTVRPTHRRQGLLRRLMQDSLAAAQRNDIPVAALTVTEATIYGRFGFGPATFHHSIEVDAGPRFALDHTAGGTVEYVTMSGLAEIAEHVFDAFHRQHPGSVRRHPQRSRVITGALDRETYEPSTQVRAAAHWDDDGVVDGYLTWRYVGEFTHQQIEIIDLIATTDQAHLALWSFIGSFDLVEKVRWPRAPIDDPLPWAMRDRRGYAINGSSDDLWLRVLDPATVFTARRYRHDGQCSFQVIDPLGIADGSWRLEVTDGIPSMTPIPEGSADLDVDVAALGSLLVGGVRAGALAAAGLLRGTPEHVADLDLLLYTPRAPRSVTPF